MEISKYCAYEPLHILISYIYNNCTVLLNSENKRNWKMERFNLKMGLITCGRTISVVHNMKTELFKG